MSKIVVNGCSHTWGWGLPKEGTPWPSILFPGCVNLAQCGDSNPAIARRTLEYLVCNPDVTHVFIMWTDNARTELSTQNGRLVHCFSNVSWGSRFPLTDLADKLDRFLLDYYKYFFSEKYHLKRFLLDLHHLKILCESRGIKFLCAASMGIDFLDDPEIFKKQFNELLNAYPGVKPGGPHEQNQSSDVDSFLSLINETKSAWIDQSYKQGHALCLEEKYQTSYNDQHANQEGHIFISNKLRQLLPKDWV